MKKSLKSILAASDVVLYLTKKRYTNWSTALKLTKAHKDMNSNKEFYMEQVKILLDEYANKKDNGSFDIDEQGNFTFKDIETAHKFQTELNNLQSTEVEVFDPITIDISQIQDQLSLTPEEISKLDGFIIFTEEKANA